MYLNITFFNVIENIYFFKLLSAKILFFNFSKIKLLNFIYYKYIKNKM